MSRRWNGNRDAEPLGILDAQAIARVREEAWPHWADVDELHDALVTVGSVSYTHLTLPTRLRV